MGSRQSIMFGGEGVGLDVVGLRGVCFGKSRGV